MKDLKQLFSVNKGSSKKIKINGNMAVFRDKTDLFYGKTILNMIEFINNVNRRYRGIKFPIQFNFDDLEIADKFSYILFEYICYYIVVNLKRPVQIYWNPKESIYTDGVFGSCLKYLNCERPDYDKYIRKFNFDISRKHYRRIITIDEYKSENYLGKFFTEINNFMKNCNLKKENRIRISELIQELVANVCEHAAADCLIDFDVTPDYIKEINNKKIDGFFYGINVVVLNFSSILIGDALEEKINCYDGNDERFKELIRIFDTHKNLFDEDYIEKDFYILSSLQDKISGRLDFDKAGGTGLTLLIKSLQQEADIDECYLLSGDRSLVFSKEDLNYNKDGWLAFNKESDLGKKPSDRVVTNSYINFPGTGYNLFFIMQREV